MLIQDVRLSFPSLFKPAAPMPGDQSAPKYKATFILPKNHPQLAEIKTAIAAVVASKWGDTKPAGLKICLRDGAEKDNVDGFGADVLFFNSSTEVRPAVFDRNRSPLTAEDGRPYAGCYVNALVEFWAQDNSYGKRINATLRGVQFVRDGEAFGGGGRPADADDFPELAPASCGVPGLDDLL